jgi:hypothetical protein
MSEEILGLDEAERIAKEYVKNKENVSDVEVESSEPSAWAGVPVYVVQVKAKRKTIDTTTWQAGVVEECSFTLWISAKDGHIRGYKPGNWGRKTEGQYSPPNSQPEVIFCEPVELLGARGLHDQSGVHVGSPIDDMLDRQADRGLKKAQEAKEKAKADYYKEKAKGEKYKRSRDFGL